MYDVMIIGSGPAGLAAAIYAMRATLKTLVLEKEPMSGGQILTTFEVDNYPGLHHVSGIDLGRNMRKHADALGARFVREEVVSIEDAGTHRVVVTDQNRYETKTVVLALGAKNRMLKVPGEEELVGMGVSYCATCDGAFFKDRPVIVVGGGDAALEEALLLSRGCSQVYLIHRRESFRGAGLLQQQVQQADNITICLNTVVEGIAGEDCVESVLVYNRKEDKRSELEVSGVFISVGTTPNTQTISGLPAMDEKGYILAGEDGVTSMPGVFAAGDCRTKALRQVLTAAADGANAISSAERYIYEH